MFMLPFVVFYFIFKVGNSLLKLADLILLLYLLFPQLPYLPHLLVAVLELNLSAILVEENPRTPHIVT